MDKTFEALLPGFSEYLANCPARQLEGGLINLTPKEIEINGIKICDYEELGGAGKLFAILAEINGNGRRMKLNAQ